jgi:hypothetical protein
MKKNDVLKDFGNHELSAFLIINFSNQGGIGVTLSV